MKIEEKTILWKPVSEYTGGRVLATNGLDILIGELNPEGDCVSEDCSGIHLCGITHFAKIDGFFPELAESEDERIRKAIIATIHLYYGEPLEDEAKEMIAWLEKQKTSEEALQYLRENHSSSEMSDFQAAMNIAVAKAYDKGYNDGLEKQGEQKPTDEDMKTLLRTEYEKGRADAIVEMQTPAWSEEDKKIWEEVSNILWEGYKQSCSKFTWDDIRDWVKPKIESFKDRVQPKQEWGEEDECYMSECIGAIATKDGWSFEEKRKTKHWLKSLKERCTWKPSDEQIKALHDLNLTGNISYAGQGQVLIELYNDLKKLAEE